MIKAILTNEILQKILQIERNKDALERVDVPDVISNKLRKNSRKRSSYASNRIEGNPLTYEQAEMAIDTKNRHFLKPEQEIRNYYIALEMLEKKLVRKEQLSMNLILEVQKQIVSGESEEKAGLRGPMPPGMLFAVYDSMTGQPEYIPPLYSEVPDLMQELIEYVNTSEDHPVIKSAVFHYQLVTIHPFEDGNGRTARILSDYILKYYGYGFKDLGSIEEYISYDLDEYYSSLQMGLPALYYDGRNNPPSPEIWITYYLKILTLYSSKVLENTMDETNESMKARLSHLSGKARAFIDYLKRNGVSTFSPVQMAGDMGVSNRTIINWSTELCANGFLEPENAKERVRRYRVL